jgi:transposase
MNKRALTRVRVRKRIPLNTTGLICLSDYKGAALMVDALPTAQALLGDRGYDASWFRKALIARGITPCIPSKRNRKVIIDHDKTLYGQRHKIENMFGRLKDCRRIHTRYDRCAHTFMSATVAHDRAAPRR